MESASSGIIAGKSLARKMKNQSAYLLPENTMMGALAHYVSHGGTAEFQPMGANMGLLPPLTERIRGKQERYQRIAEQAINSLTEFLQNMEG